MTPNPNAFRSTSLAASSPATQMPLRLQLDPNRPAEPYLDGAWWPRSAELPAELSALLTALSAHLGPIALVGYHRNAWNAAPGHLDLAGHTVHLQGFVSPDPPTVVVIADSGRRVTVRVVPPESDSATAAQAMTAATHRPFARDTDAPATKAATAEANSLDEVAARLARLPGNTDPEQVALICGWVAEAAAPFSDAPIQAFVPILVEHIVRGRIHNNRADRPARNT
jgi:Family of unknown function (DUF5994)